MAEFALLLFVHTAGADAETMAAWDWKNMTPERFAQRVDETTHCSALIKVNADLTELWMSHGELEAHFLE